MQHPVCESKRYVPVEQHQILRLLAPYLAVLVFWCILSSAWLAILAYHVQILFWSRHHVPKGVWRLDRRRILLAPLTVLAGPLLYVLLPHITHMDLSAWLGQYNLSGVSFLIMVPYFGLLHPLLEQVHWTPLREETPLAHVMFAGYHMLVLHSLLTTPWLVLCVLVLATASWAWQQMVRRSGSLLTPTLSHMLADLGVIIAAWTWVQGH